LSIRVSGMEVAFIDGCNGTINYMAEPHTNGDERSENLDKRQVDHALSQIQESLRGLRIGSVLVIVQDGIVVQIERTEKKRIQRPAAKT